MPVPPRDDSRPRLATRGIWIAAGVVALAAALAVFWPGTRNSPAPAPSPLPAEPQLPPEWAALGEDPDGDGTGTADELRAGTNPLVADVPEVQFAFEDVEFGLRVETSTVSSRDDFRVTSHERLDSWDAVHTAGVERHQVETVSATAYSGGASVRAGQYAVPIGYAGRHEQHQTTTTTHAHTAFAVRAERLEAVRNNITRRMDSKNEQKVGADAGYFHTRVSVVGSHPCRLEDFSVNVLIDGKPFATVPATRDPNFRPLHLTGASVAESLVLQLNGFNTQEMRDRLFGARAPVVALEVLAGGVKLAEFNDAAKYANRIRSVRGTCARVDVVQDGKRSAYYVSTVSGPGSGAVPFTELLRRLDPAGAGPTWGVGPSGDYLKEFRGRAGVDALDPERPGDTMWCLFHNGGEAAGEVRGRAVRAGDHVRLQHVSSRQYWGADEWVGYTESFKRLLDVQAREHDFWSAVDGIDAATGRPWTAQEEANLLDQARRLRDLYRALLGQPLAPATARLFPRVAVLGDHLGRFEKWFTDGAGLQFRGLQTHSVTVTGAQVSWNLDKPMRKPEATITVTRADGSVKTVRSSGFAPDGDGRSGRLQFADGRFEWSPFDTVELRFRVNGDDALAVRFTAYSSLAGLLQTHGLATQGADPQLSFLRVACEVARDGQALPSHPSEFIDRLVGERPRVLPLVPVELYPEPLAMEWAALHHPIAHNRAAQMFRDLFRLEKGDPARYRRLARAILSEFRSFQYRRCAELARDIPEDKDVTPEMLALFPPNVTPASLRQICAASAEAAKLAPDSADLRLLRRATQLQSATFRLSYLAKDPTSRVELDTAAARKWRDALAEDARRERSALGQCQSLVVKERVTDLLGVVDTRLVEIEGNLK